MDASNLIVGGDFNYVMDPALDKNSSSPSQASSEPIRNKIRMLKEEWNLSDVWRIRNPSKSYTFRRGPYASRLDFFLTSLHLLDWVKNTTFENMVHSDHAMIALSIQPTVSTRGPDYWKFDASLLNNDTFLTEMSQFLSNWIPPEEISNPNTIWDWFNCEIRNRIRAFTKDLHSEEKQLISNLTKKLEALYVEADENQWDKSIEIESLRRELKELEEAKARKTIFRSRANWSLHGERPK